MAKKLTAKFIESLKPGDQRREISDRANGLFLISQPSGARSFAIRYRHAGKPIKLTIGQWPATSLADARKAAADAQHALAQGSNPAAAKADAKVKADAAKADTLTAICESYLRREGPKLRSLGARVSILRRQVYPVLGSRPIGEIKRSEVVHLLDRVEDRSGPRAADVTLGVLRTILHWHERRSDEFRSPIIRGMQRQKTADHRRSRILDDDEICAAWAATADGTVFSSLVRFLLLTSARRNEAAGMKWDEVDANGLWTLPAGRSKTKVDVARPLSRAALAVLNALPRLDGCPYAFPSSSLTPLAQFSVPKKRLDKASGVKAWRLHDLRRTSRSLLARAGINSDIAEKCLGHSRGDIVERYDRHGYVDEMRHAFEALSALIERIVNPPDANVVALRG
jgi:integrase